MRIIALTIEIICLHRSKNIDLLNRVREFVRSIGGGRATCCKSGKDRTSMSATLEQVLYPMQINKIS